MMAALEPYEWDAARERWEIDGLSNAALAKEIGVSKSAVTGYAKRNGWVRKINVSDNVSDVSSRVTEDAKTQIESSVERVSDAETKAETKEGRGGVRENSGRPSSAQTILNQTIKERAAIHGDSAIETMVELMVDDQIPANVRLAAAEKLLDRGFGKPKQEVEMTGEVSYVDKTMLDEFYAAKIIEMSKNEDAIDGRIEIIKSW